MPLLNRATPIGLGVLALIGLVAAGGGDELPLVQSFFGAGPPEIGGVRLLARPIDDLALNEEGPAAELDHLEDRRQIGDVVAVLLHRLPGGHVGSIYPDGLRHVGVKVVAPIAADET